ncbi:MAG: radical SAM protein [Desulfobacteraceae bacterium]|nr:radical SAM protein [Desulfobacteraceae bacterium]
MKYGFPEGADVFPKMVVVNVSYVCNAKCVHCVHTIDSSSRKVVGDDIFVSEEAFKKLADECGDYGSYIRITGTGEPLLHPNILELIKYAKDRGCKVSMITNGSLLTPEKTDFLLACNIDGIEISVDAMSQETYEAVRRGLNFEKLLSNVRYLRQKRDNISASTNIVVSFVEEDLNRHERYMAEDFWVPEYVDNIQFRVWLQYGKMQSTEDRRSLMPDREPCPYPFERINMDSQGKFHLCAFDIDHDTDYGSISDRPLIEIWRDSEIEGIRELLLARRFDDIPICSRCTDWGCRSWEHNFWKLHNK